MFSGYCSEFNDGKVFFFFFFHWSNKKNLMVYVYISHTYGSTRLPSLESGKGKKIVTMYVG